MIKGPQDIWLTVDEAILKLERYRGCQILFSNVDGIRVLYKDEVKRVDLKKPGMEGVFK